MRSRKLRRLQSALLGGLASLLALGLSQFWMPGVSAQLPNLWDLNQSSNRQPSIQYIKRGNVHIADVRLDGVPLFKVAAAAANDDGEDRRNILPIEWRVNEIETRLNKIVRGEIDPEALRVTVSTLNSQVAIVVAERDWEQLLMTVTELDRQIDSTSSTLAEIAEMRAEQIETALLEAHRERQPDYLQQQFSHVLMGLLVAIVSSLIMRQFQRVLKRHGQRLNSSRPVETALETLNTTEENVEDVVETAIAATPPAKTAQNPFSQPLSRWRSFLRLQWWLQRWRWPQLSLSQHRNINLTLRFLLWWGQLSLWLVGAIIALLIFPQTRGAGVWLLLVPIKFVAILLGLGAIKKILDLLVVYGLNKWAEPDASIRSPDRRIALRMPVIIQVYQEVTYYLVIGVGILLFLYAIQASLTLVIAGLAVVGFSVQNLIKDWIGGFLVLWEDQYTQGDVVKINDISGLVESLHLRTTQYGPWMESWSPLPTAALRPPLTLPINGPGSI